MLNIKIIKAFRGKGHGLEALDLLLEHFFESWDGKVMEDSIWERNPKGLRILLKYGFVPVSKKGDEILVEMRKESWERLYHKALA